MRETKSHLTLASLGERALLGNLLKRIGGDSRPGSPLLVPPGDDAAALFLPAGEAALLTTDTLVEGTHFRRPWTAPADLGWKLVMSAASDVSAMGGRPLALVIAVSAPGAMAAEEFLDLMAGAQAAATDVGCALAGGDTTSSPILVLTATLVGAAPKEGLLRRTGARPGDLVLVTGTLGEAAAGLGVLDLACASDPLPEGRWLRAESPLPGLAARLEPLGFSAGRAAALAESARRFLRPSPPFAAGRVLAAAGASALIDISDGVASEAAWIAAGSQVGIVLEAARMPIGDGARAWAAKREIDPLDLALGGGEDYELLMTAPPHAGPGLVERLEAIGIPATVIGEVVPADEGLTLRLPDGVRRPLPPAGYEHFAPRP
jgi:thiamine-monophosphate kinase